MPYCALYWSCARRRTAHWIALTLVVYVAIVFAQEPWGDHGCGRPVRRLPHRASPSALEAYPCIDGVSEGGQGQKVSERGQTDDPFRG